MSYGNNYNISFDALKLEALCRKSYLVELSNVCGKGIECIDSCLENKDYDTLVEVLEYLRKIFV